ncbi:MAG: phosphatase domain-containing protein [Vulcanimicrobiota bacterium]
MGSMPSVEALASEITRLQAGYTSRVDERLIVQLFTSVRGRELTTLKTALDRGGDHRDLQQLLYRDLGRKSRQELLEHIRLHSPRPDEFEQPPLRLVSDIDDTIYASIHDRRYPRGTRYPGVLAFYEEVQRASLGPDSNLTGLVLLTARPSDRLGLVERWTKRQLARHGLPEPIVLGGSLAALRSHQSMAAKKLQNFNQYQALYPEFDFLFVGDSGQGDVLLAQALHANFADRLYGALIHHLGPQPQQEGIHYFESYLEAAVVLLHEGLLDEAACQRVRQASLREYRSIAFSSRAQAETAWASLEKV